MEQTIQALAGILLKAIPTAIIVLLLHFYLKAMLFHPLEKVLKQRDEATGGAKKSAQASLDLAGQKAAEFEAAIRDARAGVFREQEASRGKLIAAQEARVKEARAKMSADLEASRIVVEAEARSAREGLSAQTAALADQIANAVLLGRAS